MEKWKNKYRILSTRATWWDYSGEGTYFITICTINRVHYFGNCNQEKMKLSALGAIVQGFWYEIPKHFPFVDLGEFIVMPNHIHGIISVKKDENQPVVNEKSTFYSKISPKKGSVASVIRSFKSVCSKCIRENFPQLGFGWQPLYWDNIIQNEPAFEKISNYIINNPANWEKDKFYT